MLRIPGRNKTLLLREGVTFLFNTQIYKASSHRSVSTWSPLGNAFNNVSFQTSPLVQRLKARTTGLFGYEELRSANGFVLLQENVESHCSALVAEATNPRRERKMVEIFDELSDTLCKVADMAGFVQTGHPQYSYAYAAENACININGLVEKLNTNRELYNALRQVVEKGDIFPCDEIDKHVAKLFLFDFEQSGIHLDKEKREKVVALNDYILRLGSHFVQNSSVPRSVPKGSLPEHLAKRVTTYGELVDAIGPVANSSNELDQELAYRSYLLPDPHQDKLLDLLLASRHSLAELCGFPSYAHKAIKGSLANDPDYVKQFLKTLAEELRPLADRDYDEMLKMKRKDTTSKLFPWDVPYFTATCKQKKYDYRSSDYTNYFSLGACMEGLSNLFSSLYGVHLNVEDPYLGDVWHDDVIKVAVLDGNTTLGYIYCDFFDRANKSHQDCHFTIRGGKVLADGSYQLPVVTLFMTLQSPQANRPSLLTPSMMDNLFHEMGHAMHSILGRTKYQHVTGTRCPTDFAEVPSILMEFFASDPRILSSFARHYKTGEPIPEHLLRNLQGSKRAFMASDTQLQLFYASLDQELHSAHPLGKSTIDVLKDVQNEFYSLPHVPNTAWHHRFSHLVGYGAKYYAYLVSRSVASWIWHTHFKDDPFSSQAGMQYRNGVLVHGGGKPPKDIVSSYLGQEATPENLVKGLMLELRS